MSAKKIASRYKKLYNLCCLNAGVDPDDDNSYDAVLEWLENPEDWDLDEWLAEQEED